MASAFGFQSSSAPAGAARTSTASTSSSTSDVSSGEPEQDDERKSFRLTSCGWLNRENEVFLSLPTAGNATCNVIFFPGDVQDFHATMLAGPFASFSEYSYEAVAMLVAAKFGSACNVWVIRPSHFQHGAYSSFDNFVATNDYGAATEYDPTGSSTKHLASLMQNTEADLKLEGVSVSTALPIHLLGFSKGGIVLNQLVTELVRYSFNKKRSNTGQERQGSAFASTRQFFSAVKSIHWLDSGNGSLHGVLPSNELALSILGRYDQMKLFVHVTPYQYEAKERPWIKTEVQQFVSKMNLLGADLQLMMYYEGDEGSLELHFHLLQDFEVNSAFREKVDGATNSPEHAVQPVRIQGCK